MEVIVDGGANDILSCFYDFDELLLNNYDLATNGLVGEMIFAVTFSGIVCGSSCGIITGVDSVVD